MIKNFHSNGKLLLTSEYLVIDGAQALALPCHFGQSMSVEEIEEPEILWESYTDEGKLWFETLLVLKENKFENVPFSSSFQHQDAAENLIHIFNVLLEENPELFSEKGYIFKNRLEFPQIWGLGSSSTLINNLASWAKTDAFQLAQKTFGGSGYDIACAQQHGPILYQRLQPDQAPVIKRVDFNPDFKKFIFFVHLGKKQNTREAIFRYQNLNPWNKEESIKEVNRLTQEILTAKDLFVFEDLIDQHERLISDVIELHTIQNTLFPDYPRIIKSLGAWGGDFIMATGGTEEREYFKDKGYTTIMRYRDMILE